MKGINLITFWLGCIFIGPVPVSAQNYVRFDSGYLILDNGVVHRRIMFYEDKQKVGTDMLNLEGSSYNFIGEQSHEFSFTVNDRPVNGQSGWHRISVILTGDDFGGKGASLKLKGTGENNKDLEVNLEFMLYPGLPVIRKRIRFENTGNTEIKLESLDVEDLSIAFDPTHSWILQDYGRYKHLGSYTGTEQDPVVIVHEISDGRGLVLGNESPGVLKRTTVYEVNRQEITIGLTHPGQREPFRVWLEPGQEWESPWVFTGVYEQVNDVYAVLNGMVGDFVRKFMGIRLNALTEKPLFVYNTWNPFRKDISDSLIRRLAKAAAECGVGEFVIDDGWSTNRGDWEVDREKFPDGLKPVFDYIRSLGMKPGLWISIATADTSSIVLKSHPEWFIRDRQGELANLHTDNRREITACMGTDWFDYIRDKIISLIKANGIEYLKMDLTIVRSAYVTDPYRSGCYAKDHPFHKDREESFLVNYRRCFDLFDAIHQEAPQLFIDCTFETMGAFQLIDYSTVKYAEGDWLSNFEESNPLGSFRVRQMAWWRTPAIPSSSLVIGNLVMDDPDPLLSFKSLAGTLPIMLGNPVELSADKRTEFKEWSVWLKNMQAKYNYSMYRQDLAGFGEPTWGNWDGWSRINTDTRQGGIIGIFRQGGHQENRKVVINGLGADRNYVIRQAPDGKELYRLKGEELSSKGFNIKLEKEYDGILLEIEGL